MTYYYKPGDNAVPSGIAIVPDTQGYYLRQSLSSVPPPPTPSHIIGPSIIPPPVSSVIYPRHMTTPVYPQMMAPMTLAPSLAPYHMNIRPSLVAPSTLTYQPVGGLAPSSAPVAPLGVPRPYYGGPANVAPQQGISFIVAGGNSSSNGLYQIPSYNFPAAGVYQYPTISSPYRSTAPVASSYPIPPNPARLPLHHGSVVTIGRAATAINSNVPRANYRP